MGDDSLIGQCAQIDLTKLGKGALNVNSLEFRTVSDGCHDDLDVYACFYGKSCEDGDSWTRISNAIDGGGRMPVHLGASVFGDSRVEALRICVDHANGCNHKLDWAKVSVAY
jgi:hypothetical protein